jgi:penicillin-binding protein A
MAASVGTDVSRFILPAGAMPLHAPYRQTRDPSSLPVLDTLVHSAPWPVLRGILHIGFLVAMLLLLKRMHQLRDVAGTGPALGTLLLLLLPFAAVLGYQATWQLTGVLRPRFIAFMQIHDRRAFNPAHRLRRGRILDRRGRVLAYSREYRGQVYRLYPLGPVLAHVVGYSDPQFGASGVEEAANVYLNGGAPASLPDWGELGRQVVTQDIPRGRDLTLTLDADLQQLALGLLAGRAGAVVALSPADGAVRVLASSPSFDPNRLSPALFQGTDPSAPLLNRATQGLYPPGSTFKVVMAAEALGAGFTGTIDCPAEGFTTSAGYPRIRDHEYYTARRSGRIWGGHGAMDLAAALVHSSNVFFAKLGTSYGVQALYRNTERFLFNHPVVIDEGPYGTWTLGTGEIPHIGANDHYGLAQISLGQGRALATPAHMALIAAAVADGGLAMRPHLAALTPPHPLARLMPATVARRIAHMLRRVVSEGTARDIETAGLAIAGKTGTAENAQGQPHSWFIGFAPARHPGLAVAVLVEHGGFGARAAAPIARDLLLHAHQLGLLE